MEITVQITAICALCHKRVSDNVPVSQDGLVKYDTYSIDGIQEKWSDEHWENVVCCDECEPKVK